MDCKSTTTQEDWLKSPHKGIVKWQKRGGGREWYHSNHHYDFANNRRCFLGTLKGLLSCFESQKSGLSIKGQLLRRQVASGYMGFGAMDILKVHGQNVRFQNVRFQNAGFKTSSFKMSDLQNVRFTKRQIYKTSNFKTSGFKTSIEIKAQKRPIFKFDILIKQKV